ncbi:unnamed protein product [Diatraea saccharalis]|uniref:Uncharacterized protein n=1 Tax=Diatraea saccharalis TaxID=40085 RepID=A0A9P0C5T1_9NEOP|nr:unnamed protein product [Diatraea saccharalis]
MYILYCSYETGNGIKREETSYEKVIPKTRSAGSEEGEENDDSNEIHVQEGSYSYVAPDGTVISVKYIADENGFRPVGDHLPRAPGLVPQTSTGEKSGRALKSDLKKAESKNAVSALSKSEPEESPKEVAVVAEKDSSPLASETSAISSEKSSSEVSSNSAAVKNEPTTLPAAEESKAKSDSTSAVGAASVTEAAATAAAPEAPVSTTEAATETLNTKEASSAEAVSSAESSTTQAASSSEVASTAGGSSPKSESEEQPISESATAAVPLSSDISTEKNNPSTTSS